MTRRPVTEPRKHAAQRRSRVTVDALIEATARILVGEGFERASTNRIAEVAGVSIGSLYQYFPGKDALVAAVIDRHHRDVMRLVRRVLAGIASLPIEAGVRRIVAAAIEAHRIDPNLHRVLSEQIPRTGRLENVEAFNSEALALFRDYLVERRDEIRVVDIDAASFICGMSIEAVAHAAVLSRPDRLTDEAAAVLIDETTRLVVGYLLGAGRAPARGRLAR